MPTLDLHGEDRISAKIKINTFIEDCYKMKNYEIAIVHGIGKGILKKEVLNMLQKDKRVVEYCIDCFNEGCTLAKLDQNIDKNGQKCYNNRHNLRGRL